MISCSAEKEIDDREYITTCYKFVESESKDPIRGLHLLIHYGDYNVLGAQGVTDDEGMWCFDHWNDEGPFGNLTILSNSPVYYSYPGKLPMNGSLNTIEIIYK
ncbi:hypothetical protein [Tamlana flava]|uniref:hypothetical protein n=1 Tax=Tamlana flava TaxID=3158572 RepID=UPI00351B4E0A